MIPAPVVPLRGAYQDEVPEKAWRVIQAATANGWRVRVTYVRGYRIDTAHHGPGGHWDQVRNVVVREPVVGEDGAPEMTLPSKRFPAGQPRVREVDTGEPMLVDSVAVRARRGDRAAWCLYVDGAYEVGQISRPWSTVGVTALIAFLKTVGPLG